MRAQLTAAGLREEAQAAALANPRITQQLVAQRAAAGVPTPLAAIEAADVVHETLQLVTLLPDYALAGICGCSEERLIAYSASDVSRARLNLGRAIQRKHVAQRQHGRQRRVGAAVRVGAGVHVSSRAASLQLRAQCGPEGREVRERAGCDVHVRDAPLALEELAHKRRVQMDRVALAAALREPPAACCLLPLKPPAALREPPAGRVLLRQRGSGGGEM